MFRTAAQTLLVMTLLAGVGFSSSAEAFRPSARWLFDQAAAAQLKRNISTLRVEQEVTLQDPANPNATLEVTGRIWIRAPQGMRVERLLSNGEYVEVWSNTKTMVQRPGEGELKRKTRPDLLYAFFTIGAELDRKVAADRLEEVASAAKINLDVVSFVRFNDEVNYLIGCKPWEVGEKPAIFLAKDTLLPTRLVTLHKAASGDVVHDLQLRGWGSPEGGSWFPKTVEHFEGPLGKERTLTERAVTRTVERNEAVDKLMFEVR